MTKEDYRANLEYCKTNLEMIIFRLENPGISTPTVPLRWVLEAFDTTEIQKKTITALKKHFGDEML